MDGLAFLDAALLELFIDALDAPDVLEAADGFIIVEIRHRDEFFERLAADDEITGIVTRDFNLLRLARCILVIDDFVIRRLRLLNIIVEPFADVGNELLEPFVRRS